ncbi:hypothetical protein CPB83DRAFT_856382 [Crepidotus variabilis]|uniref:Uncharacterized protein n=1 Tax=Crepidotus variabilis TaxID=179855 RepID=A0A9P6EEB2_9AGAR|nr:hypothetical protein CPB83DRAFT_856382 [Crepidotus variabilis]
MYILVYLFAGPYGLGEIVSVLYDPTASLDKNGDPFPHIRGCLWLKLIHRTSTSNREEVTGGFCAVHDTVSGTKTILPQASRPTKLCL